MVNYNRRRTHYNESFIFDYTTPDNDSGAECITTLELEREPQIGSSIFLKKVRDLGFTDSTMYKVVDVHYVMAEVHNITEEEADKAWIEVCSTMQFASRRPKIRDMHPMVLDLILRNKGWNRVEVMVKAVK